MSNIGDKVLIFPTDTVYGIGASVYSKKGQDRIYEIKHRDRNKPLAVLCANLKQIDEIAYLDNVSKALINEFLPGAVTFILNAKPIIKEIMGIDTVGVRIPNSKLALTILTEFGAMATTSVNESGDVPLDTYDEIYEAYSDKVDYIYKKEEESSSHSSTVISLVDNLKVLREGAITKEKIEEFLRNKDLK